MRIRQRRWRRAKLLAGKGAGYPSPMTEMGGVRWSIAGAFLAAGLAALVVAPEGCSSDSFVTTDASDDGAPHDGGGSFCSAHPPTGAPTMTFCDDFEGNTGTGFDPQWQLDVTAGSTVAHESIATGGFDFLSTTPASGGGAKRKAQLFYNPNALSISRLRMSMKVKIAAPCAEGANLFGVAGLAAGAAVGIGVGVGPVNDRSAIGMTVVSAAGDAGKVDGTVGSGDVPFDTWTDASFEVTLGRPRADGGGSNGIDLKVVLGGQTRIDIVGAEGGSAIVSPVLYIGAVVDKATSSCSMRYDDVLFELNN